MTDKSTKELSEADLEKVTAAGSTNTLAKSTIKTTNSTTLIAHELTHVRQQSAAKD